jgi:hypothetical protein
MSREELGNDVMGDVVDSGRSSRPPGRASPISAGPAPSGTNDDGPGGDGPGDRSCPPRPWPRGHLVASSIVVVLSALMGFGSARVWNDASIEGSLLASDPIAWAVVVEARPATGVARTALDLVVRLTNLGRSTITVSGSESTDDAGSIESVVPDGLGIEEGGSTVVLVHASIDCSSPKRLRLYPLQVRRGDQTLHAVEIMGATAELARSCQAQAEHAHVVLLTGVGEEDGQLRLTFSSPTGRTTRVLGLRAGEVTLTGEPSHGLFDTRPWTTWIRPPRTCPTEWIHRGLPRTVTVDVDAGGAVPVTLDATDALPRWLLRHSCRAQG